jgi:RNA polymerase sigma factor for flagellar operon FliA
MEAVDGEKWKKYKETRDKQLRNDIFEQYFYIVKIRATIVCKTVNNWSNKDDLESCGSIALLSLIDKFDYDRNVRFATYASPRIHGSMLDFLRKQDFIPRQLRNQLKAVDKVIDVLKIELDRYPTAILTDKKIYQPIKPQI